MTEHKFTAQLSWQPLELPFTYKEYSRQYLARIDGKPDFVGTSAPEFFGSRYHYNPEDMLVVSVAACHLLTYLAVAANSKIVVTAYTDDPEGTLSNESGVFKFKEVILRPRITLAAGTDIAKAEALHEKAHKNCFIANSVNFPIIIAGTMQSDDPKTAG